MEKILFSFFIHFFLFFSLAYGAQYDNEKSWKRGLGLCLLKALSKPNNEEQIVELISCGADANWLDETSGETPLIVAVRNGNYENIKTLLDKGARPSQQGYDLKGFNDLAYWTNPLIEAIKKNDDKSMLLLAQKGGRPFKLNCYWAINRRDFIVCNEDYAPINYVVQLNNLDNTEKLLKFAIDLDCDLHKSKNFSDYYKKVSSVLCYKQYLIAVQQSCFYTKSSFLSSHTKDYSYKDYLTKSLTFLLCVRRRYDYIKLIDKKLFLNYIVLPAIRGTFPVLSEAITVGRRFLEENQKEMHSIFNNYESKYSHLFPENRFIKIEQKTDKGKQSCIIA